MARDQEGPKGPSAHAGDEEDGRRPSLNEQETAIPSTSTSSEAIGVGAAEAQHNGQPKASDGPASQSSSSRSGPLREFFNNWKGGIDTPLAPDISLNTIYSFLGAFISILIIAVIDQYGSPKESFDVPYLVASFGASAVLVFGVPAAKLSQPRNLVGGQCFSALTGIIVRLIIQPQYGDGKANFVSTALGMALSLTVMQVTGTIHPPAGATGLIAASASPIPDWHGFKYLLTVLLASLTMLLVALVFNNLVPKRRYPTFW